MLVDLGCAVERDVAVAAQLVDRDRGVDRDVAGGAHLLQPGDRAAERQRAVEHVEVACVGAGVAHRAIEPGVAMEGGAGGQGGLVVGAVLRRADRHAQHAACSGAGADDVEDIEAVGVLLDQRRAEALGRAVAEGHRPTGREFGRRGHRRDGPGQQHDAVPGLHLGLGRGVFGLLQPHRALHRPGGHRRGGRQAERDQHDHQQRRDATLPSGAAGVRGLPSHRQPRMLGRQTADSVSRTPLTCTLALLRLSGPP